MKKIAVLFFALLISSCSVLTPQESTTIKSLLPVGSTLQLTQEIEIPAGRFYMYIAKGKVAPLKNYNIVNIYEPYCMLGFNDESLHIRHIKQDTFKVTKVVEWEGYYSSLDTEKAVPVYNKKGSLMKVASFGSDNDAPRNIMYATIISLYSDKQPDVKKIVCGHWNDEGVVEALTLKEMINALGELVIINKTGAEPERPHKI